MLPKDFHIFPPENQSNNLMMNMMVMHLMYDDALNHNAYSGEAHDDANGDVQLYMMVMHMMMQIVWTIALDDDAHTR